jgi:hypothetical protein
MRCYKLWYDCVFRRCYSAALLTGFGSFLVLTCVIKIWQFFAFTICQCFLAYVSSCDLFKIWQILGSQIHNYILTKWIPYYIKKSLPDKLRCHWHNHLSVHCIIIYRCTAYSTYINEIIHKFIDECFVWMIDLNRVHRYRKWWQRLHVWLTLQSLLMWHHLVNI